MRKTVMVLAAVLALMFGGASIAVGADHNRPEGNDNSPCAEDHPGAASEKNPHCTGEGPPGHQDDDPETDTVEADLEAPEEDGGDEVAEEDGDDDAVEEDGGDGDTDEEAGDDDAEEGDEAAGNP